MRSRGSLRFCQSNEGVTAIEFALSLPIVLLVLSLCVYVSQSARVQNLAALTAQAAADLVAQQTDAITAAQVDCLLQIAAESMTPMSTATLSIVVSEVTIGTNGDATVNWSRGAYLGKARQAGTTISAATLGSQAMQSHSDEVVAEISYAYAPLGIYVPVSPTATTSLLITEAIRGSASFLR